MKTILVALGGNALIKEGQKGKVEEQIKNVDATTKKIAELIRKDYTVVLTHGNGPQVGNLEIQMSCETKIPKMPLDVEDAMTQGQIGYLIQKSLRNFLPEKEILTVVTEIEVNKKDPAFRNPSKPIGPFYSKEKISELKIKDFIEDSGRGYRKVVASPEPKKILQIKAIKELMKKGSIVVCCGGGGIPVTKKGKKWNGIEAVIDKDKASTLLAVSLGIKEMIILTDVEFVYLNYNKKNQQKIRKIKVKELKELLEKNEFGKGSMKPKIESCIKFIESGGKKAVITSLDRLVPALKGKTGTQIS
ncbi:MAG: carbamate kinase [archaeon]